MGTAVVATLAGVVFVLLGSALAGTLRPRRYSTPADFYVAARAVRPWWNASAISSEYTSAAAYFGLVGLIAAHGAKMLWYSVGAAAGFLVLLVLVVAPLRRSGTYTLSDFAQWRLGSVVVRRVVTVLVLFVGLVYLVAQLHAAGIVLRLLTGFPPWAGWLAVAFVVLAVALAGGMGSSTRVQSLQFWFKLASLAAVAGVLVAIWWRHPAHPPSGPVYTTQVLAGAGDPSTLGVVTVLIASALGVMGLPQIVVRFYTNPDGRAARRTVVAVLGMLSVFYVLPAVFGLLARWYAPPRTPVDQVLLLLPSLMAPGWLGDVLTGLLAAGAFAAFLATSCGVLVAVGGTLSTSLFGGGVGGFRRGALLVVAGALALVWSTPPGASILLVLLAFGLSAATLCPLLVLGVWWRGLSVPGAVAGLVTGAGVTALLVGVRFAGGGFTPLLRYPALVAVPAAFAVMVAISLVTRHRVPPGTDALLARMHLPEELTTPEIDRSSLGGSRSSW
ncbi:hypothetical protein Aph01nite_13810 [Acrocarpospora phusangensis]|uniref:Cation acetate symporter n=1 Tax=Acrocarpospora phusangensis TaxID=1070424 RepID=A0A919UIU1_9ACTN|nr:cation acetate symporter [Acrocarpospora phusangensis]GIH23071.1 hypothetical protein Aph01nite_13810 [Acrocarpospora phusangensis]